MLNSRLSHMIVLTIAAFLLPASAEAQSVTDVTRIATREIYCHYQNDCKDAAMGAVSGFGPGPRQCNQYVFNTPGGHGSWKGSSYQWPDGSCWNFNSAGNLSKSTKSLNDDLPNQGATIPVPWTGISCFSGDWCSGSKVGAVWNWRDCNSGLFPVQDGVPDSTTLNAKSFLWGATCYQPQTSKDWAESNDIASREISSLLAPKN